EVHTAPHRHIGNASTLEGHDIPTGVGLWSSSLPTTRPWASKTRRMIEPTREVVNAKCPPVRMGLGVTLGAGSVSPFGWSPAIVALEGMIRIETPSTRNWSVPPKGEASRSGARI